jgi:uncharacterized protein (UPF0218 family)
VPLETLITVFESGVAVEGDLEGFQVLRLDDMYAVVTYHLPNRGIVVYELEARKRKTHEIR